MTLSNSEECLDWFVSEAKAANMLDVTPKALQKWRGNGTGPRFLKISARCVRYRIKDLYDWAEGRTVQSTSEVAG